MSATARIGRQYPTDPTAAELANAEGTAARAQLADLACAVADAVAWAESEPGFASTISRHPMRVLRRALDRARAVLGHTHRGMNLTPAAASRVMATANEEEMQHAALCILMHRQRKGA